MFESLSLYLTDLHTIGPLDKAAVGTRAASSPTDSNTPSPEQRSAASKQLPRVEIVSLLTDVAGLVRERSEFTQYLNFCYTLSKESKPVLVEILPTH